MKYVRELAFDGDPDYDYMMGLVQEMASVH